MMKNLRRWALDASMPFALPLAADARLSQTDYGDDQTWELHLGTGDSPALALQTQYGGRVGLVSLVPMWTHGGRIIYQQQAYAQPPQITAFAPAFLQIEAQITPALQLVGQYWVMESHAVGGCFIISNSGQNTETLRGDLFGHVVAQEKEQKLAIVAYGDQRNALALGNLVNLRPVVVVENGQAPQDAPSPKVGVELQIAPGKSVQMRWIHAGRPDLRDSLALAQHWLRLDWQPYFAQIERAAQAIPQVFTGNDAFDAVIAAAYQHLAQAFLSPTASLPYASFVAARQPWQGYSARGDGTDQPRAWAGQWPVLAYMVGAAMATIDPALAQGILKNYLAVQTADGSIDYKPGLAGQREGILCLPILARLAWNIYEATEDQKFLSDTFEPLMKFFERWFARDMDADADGLPEWQNERQTGYVFTPTFAVGSNWAQNANIHFAECPDLLAYLRSEARSLVRMAQALGRKRPAAQMEKHSAALDNLLEALWHEGRYAYRDRDTHLTTTGVTLLDDGRGDEEHLLALPLSPANRVLVRLTGGASNVPRGKLILEGLAQDGKKITEQADFRQFVWTYGRGVYTSEQVFSQLDRIHCEGLSRVYRIQAQTVDTTRLDINALLPLWSGRLPAQRAEALLKLALDKKHFLRNSGLAMNSAQDPAFDPAGASGSGGVWPYWMGLVIEGMLEHGYRQQAADAVENLLQAQARILAEHKKFFMFYHADQPQGLGERGHLDGLPPLHLLMQLFGVQILSAGKVRVHETFAWGRAVKIQQHGVMVERSSRKIRITFPSGYRVDAVEGAGWQVIADPKPLKQPPPTPLPGAQSQPAKPGKTPRSSSKSVIIDVQIDSDDQ